MEKSKQYLNTKFSAEAIKSALKKYQEMEFKEKIRSAKLQIEDETWSHDSIEEYFDDHRKNCIYSSISVKFDDKNLLSISKFESNRSIVAVESNDRRIIQSIFSVFEEYAPKCMLPILELESEPITVFIGHGRNTSWRDLKDHLQDKHRYKVIAYETGSRAGHVIRDIVEEMSQEATMAFLVFTAEDEQADGSFHARQNVVHETGLFQGVLGFSRAIVLLEEGTEAFSNLQGIDQIRFSKGNIKETFGEVLATIKREFS